MARQMAGGMRLAFEPDGVYLHAGPSGVVDEAYTMNWLQHRQLTGLNMRDVLAGMRERRLPLRVCGPQEPRSVDEGVFVQVDKGDLQAFAQIFPAEGGRTLGEMDVLAKLKEAGVTHGFDLAAVHALVQKDYGEKACVARAKMPVEGANGELTYHFRTELTGRAVVDDHDRANYWELDLIERVRAGQVLVTRTSCVPGVDGFTVRGAPIKAKQVRDAALPNAKNATQTPDGMSLVADVDGRVEMQKGKVVVSNAYIIPGDVDMSVGHVDFGGSVQVKGMVHLGMKVVAQGAVEIKGVVEAATVTSGGDMTLSSGVQGADRAVIQCGGSIVARFIERANLVAAGSVTADAIIHSKVECGDSLYLMGKRATLIGGLARAGTQIVAKTIGSATGTATMLEVGSAAHLSAQAKTIEKEVERKRFERDKMRKLERTVGNPGADVEKRALLRKIEASLELLCAEIEQCERELQTIEERLALCSNGKVHVLERIHPGVRIQIGSAVYQVVKAIEHATFRREKDEIVFGACDYAPDNRDAI